MSNQDQKALFITITVSSSGLGRATAKLFASKGWKVIASGWQRNCQAVLGMQGRCGCSEHNSSPFELIWMTDLTRS